MLRKKSLYIFLGAILVTAIPVSAQITAPREAAQIEFGPLSLYPSLQVVDAGLDENVFNNGTAPQRDYTLTVASRVLAVVRLGANELMLQSGNDYVWFQEFDSERSSNALYAARFNLSASRFKPFIGATRVRTRARRSPEIDARARRIDRSLLGGLGFELTPRTSLTASIRFDEANYEDGEAFRGVQLDDALNRTGRAGDFGVKYAVTPLTTLTVAAGYEEQNFKLSHIRDAKRYTIGPTLEFSPEAAIRGSVITAFERFVPEDPTLSEKTGLSYQALVNWSLYGRTTFELGAGRNISYSYLDTEPYYLLTNSQLTVTHPFAERLEVYGGFDWNHMAYRWVRGATRPIGESNRVDTQSGVTGGVGFDLARGFRMRVGIEKTKRRSVEDPISNFDRTRILTTMTVGS